MCARPTLDTAASRRRGLCQGGVLGLLALALAGCLQAEKPDPALDVPGRFRAQAAPPAPPVSATWWQAFRSPELTGFAQAAQTGNLDIAIAVARVRQADAQATVAGAPLLPVLDATADATRNRPSSRAGRAAPVVNSLQAGLRASWEIDVWGKNKALADAAALGALASRHDRDAIALTALAATATTYFQILAAQERKRIANQNLASATRVLGLIRERLAAGTATSLDIAQQESVVANLRAAIPPFDQEIDQNAATLAVLTGRSPERITVRGGGLNAVVLPRVAPGVPAQLLTRRPDVQSAEVQLEAAGADVVAARAAFFPTIALTTQGGYESLALKALFGPGAAFWSVGAGLAQPIFQGFRLEGQLEQARGREAELLQTYRKSVIEAFADVERALVAQRQLALQERLQAEAEASARRAYEISVQRLREGTVDLVTVLNTQQSLFLTQDVLTRVRLLRLQAAVALYQALGGGWTFDKPRP